MEELQPIIVFGHPELIHLTKYPAHHFLDGTFSISPAGYKQGKKRVNVIVLILMIHDSASDLYVPVYYVLLPDKTQSSYYMALVMMDQVTNFQMNPLSITCDFELALHNAAREHYRRKKIEIIGCFFHLKQAWLRKLKSFQVDNNVCNQLMRPGGLDLLCYIPEDEVVEKGIPYLMSVYPSVDDQFWVYLQNTWTVSYPIQSWNISRFETRWEEIQNRTNNPLERFNREMNSRIKSNPGNLFLI